MKVRIERNKTASFTIKFKRFYIPFVIHWTCPNCGAKRQKDLDSDYLSFVRIGRPQEIWGDCKCDCEVTFEVNLDITMDFLRTVRAEIWENGKMTDIPVKDSERRAMIGKNSSR